MKIELESDLQDKNRISAYTEGCIYIRYECIDASCVITADTIIYTWKPASSESLECADFEPIIELKPEIILLGTGTDLVIPPAELCAYIQGKKIGFEFMLSGAAIRSYNILLGENRKVALALILS